MIETVTVPRSWLVSVVQVAQIGKGISDDEALKQAQERVAFMETVARHPKLVSVTTPTTPDNAVLSCQTPSQPADTQEPR